MTTPTFEERLDTILPTLATKADVAAVTTELTRLEGKMDAMTERLEGKMDAMTERLDAMTERLEGKLDAMGNRLLVRCSIVMIVVAVVAVAAVKYL